MYKSTKPPWNADPMPAFVFDSFCRDAEFILASTLSSRPDLNAGLKPRVVASCDATPASAISCV